MNHKITLVLEKKKGLKRREDEIMRATLDPKIIINYSKGKSTLQDR